MENIVISDAISRIQEEKRGVLQKIGQLLMSSRWYKNWPKIWTKTWNNSGSQWYKNWPKSWDKTWNQG